MNKRTQPDSAPESAAKRLADESQEAIPAADNFESSLNVLESLVERLESEQLGLDESLNLYEQGMGLAKRCQTLLDEARQKVELISSPNDDPVPFQPDDENERQ